jgi:polysaccharide export outer membrane protein
MIEMPLSRFGGLCALFAITAALGACAGRPDLPPADTRQVVDAARYVMGPGDTVSVFVYRAPELSADLPVRPDGRISLPLVPDIQVAGRTPSDLARDVEERLKRYVREPNVTVMVRSFIGMPNQQIRVIGEAAQPMSMPYREGLSVLDVMIASRGLTRYAAGNRAEIIRTDPATGQREVVRVRLNDLLRSGNVAQDIPMRPGDTLVIPQGWF